MSDDFFSQIQEAEGKAQKMIEHAQKKAEENVHDEQRKLEEKRAEALEKKRALFKEQLKSKQESMKDLYNQLRDHGKTEASNLESVAEPKIEKVLSEAEIFFLDLLK